MKVSVISPTSIGYVGEGESVIVPAYDGQMGILYGHAPMMTLLGDGEVVVRNGPEEHRTRVSGGFLQIVDNEVSVLAERVAEDPIREEDAPRPE
ncbi:MAG: ATP synthase F1 subunit epsilon [Gemmatimonadota bacterium]